MMSSYTTNSVVQKKQAQKFLRLIRETLESYEYEPLKIADLGTGDGVLAFALKRAYPNSYVLGVDKDAEVVKEAQKQWQEVEFLIEKYEMEGLLDVFATRCRCYPLFQSLCLWFQWL